MDLEDVPEIPSGLLEWISGASAEDLARVEQALGEVLAARRAELNVAAGEDGGGEGPESSSKVIEYRAYGAGYLQLETRTSRGVGGEIRERGPYWYFRYHEGDGKRKCISERPTIRRRSWMRNCHATHPKLLCNRGMQRSGPIQHVLSKGTAARAGGCDG